MGAKHGNINALKCNTEKRTVRRMVNMRQCDSERIDQHLASTGQKWSTWSYNVIRQAVEGKTQLTEEL